MLHLDRAILSPNRLGRESSICEGERSRLEDPQVAESRLHLEYSKSRRLTGRELWQLSGEVSDTTIIWRELVQALRRPG